MTLITPHEVERAKADLIEADTLDREITLLTTRRNKLRERATDTPTQAERQAAVLERQARSAKR